MTEHLYAVMSDIHGNFEALQAVAADAEHEAHACGLVPEYVCLGDVVNYGPQPNECIEWVLRQKPLIVVMGNHERAVLPRDWSRPQVDRDWWPIVIWTRFALRRKLGMAIREWPMMRPGSNSLGPFLCFHGDPNDTVPDNYLKNTGAANSAFSVLEKRPGCQYGLFGHTHYQMLFEHKRGDASVPRQFVGCAGRADRHCLAVNEWHDWPRRMALLNPGSVGQPRRRSEDPDWTPHAAYALLRSDGTQVVAFKWKRVRYSVETTVAQLLDLPWLDSPRRRSGEQGGDILKGDPPGNFDERDRDAYLTAEERAHVQAHFGPVRQDLIQVLKKGGVGRVSGI